MSNFEKVEENVGKKCILLDNGLKTGKNNKKLLP
jgi:hypothetical protein